MLVSSFQQLLQFQEEHMKALVPCQNHKIFSDEKREFEELFLYNNQHEKVKNNENIINNKFNSTICTKTDLKNIYIDTYLHQSI